MTSQQYCQDLVIKPGSSLHYSLRVLPAPQRQTLTALYAFFRELKDITSKCLHPEVAYAKFQWWLEDVNQIFTGQPAHPVNQALQSAAPHDEWSPQDFVTIIKGFLLNVTVTRFTTFQQLEDYCKSTSGVLSLLCTQVMGCRHDHTQQYAEQLGIALELTHLFRYLRRDLSNGRLVIPLEDLERFKVSESMLSNRQFSAAVSTLFAYQVTRIRTYYQAAFKALAPEDCFQQRSGLIRAHLALATLQEIENDGFRLFQHYITLPPLRKWWITGHTIWRAKWC